MNKKVLYLFFFLFTFFIVFNDVHAQATCAEIDEKINDYYFYNDQLAEEDCNDTRNEDSVSICNKSKMNKNAIVIELMKLNEENSICESKQADVDRIIEENESSCHKIFDDTFTNFVNRVMIFFDIIGPILLILFGSLDYAKAVAANDEAAYRKATKDFAKRVAATIMLFLTPIFTNLIISLNTSKYYLSGNAYACNFNYSLYNKEWNINYIPKVSTSKNNGKTNYSNMIYKGGMLPIPFPVDDISMTSFFGYRNDPFGGKTGNNHKGLDLISSNRSVDIVAVADGVVTRVTGGCSRGSMSCGNGYGNRVQIMHNIDGHEFETLYAHMESTQLVVEGETITAGTKLGNMGSTGQSTGNHLHFEVRIGGQQVNPLPYINSDNSMPLYQKW